MGMKYIDVIGDMNSEGWLNGPGIGYIEIWRMWVAAEDNGYDMEDESGM